MSKALAQIPDIDTIESLLINGDLSKLTTDQRVRYYNGVCKSLGLNPLTQPFDYINLSGKLRLYAKREATDQLRKIHGVSVSVKARELVENCYVVTASAQNGKGRSDESIGAVSIAGLQGEARANAMMKAETKAKRRVTLSICGLGMLDESEVESIPGARLESQSPPPYVDAQTGEELPAQPPSPPPADLPPGAVLITRIEPGWKTGAAKGFLFHSGQQVGDSGLPIYQNAVKAFAESCREANVPVFVEVTMGHASGKPYVKTITKAEREPGSDDDLPLENG